MTRAMEGGGPGAAMLDGMMGLSRVRVRLRRRLAAAQASASSSGRSPRKPRRGLLRRRARSDRAASDGRPLPAHLVGDAPAGLIRERCITSRQALEAHLDELVRVNPTYAVVAER
ncbi:MAG: hypothetical protein R3B99_30190 [Polyangiales bacterium]